MATTIKERLKSEVLGDPLGRGYSGMTDEAVPADLHTEYRTRNRSSMTGSEVINAIDGSEYGALTDGQKQLVWNVVHLGEINPFGVEADLMISAFGGGSNTIAALAALRVKPITRADELDLGLVRPGDVTEVRL